MISGMTSSSPQAFRRSLGDRIKRKAQGGSRNPQQLQRQFLLQRFLARVFAEPTGSWVLKGGTSLLIRLPDARHSQDIDLLHTTSSIEEAIAELQTLVSRDIGDPLAFVLGSPTAMSGGVAGVQVPVTVYLGATQFERFPIDLSTDLHTVAHVEHVRPAPVVDIPGLSPLPEFVLYPLPDQVADKVCAMYERHGSHQRPSTRYRDLVDLLLIATSLSLDATLTEHALKSESRRRGLDLPDKLIEPGPEWASGYRQTAKDSHLDPTLHDLQSALTRAGACLNPLLSGVLSVGTWSPSAGCWEQDSEDHRQEESCQ